ncbi:NAD(P)/FAD-dependent oxidoreductase [Paenibacillus sp. p3-SID867]|uniref:NAD(P)/FAD-dependent oxidoreductase n=1 Tax=Paenibacillus sp. p3-SID867 TaxID=2916363 RepID=UPI0021A860C5|nr:NAD(P)/FAD-dependent oxidoreductase [Paenibacillus sp. p3-SID867]MCT1398797.1 NAD(P)/FAD-dependent oxidoreductase [Paenibacillus sp. p3-SID867]
MLDTEVKDCIIIGGGIAGLQAAIQLGRYSAYDVLVIDRGTGRSTICKSYRNILGWPDGVSGEELRGRGRQQAESVGVTFAADDIRKAERDEAEYFVLTGKEGVRYRTKTLLLATGVMDRFPKLPGLMSTLGTSVFVCPDCDGYEIQDRKTVVMGSGDPGASMAVLLSERTQDIIYINHEGEPASSEHMSQLADLGIPYIEKKVSEIREEGGILSAVVLEDGSIVPAERGFISFGGNMIYSELAEQLGAELEHNRHVKTDPRSKMTSVELLWAAGDLGVHSELTTVAMGEGATAAIWINKTLKKMTSGAVT